jgi:hypothetical protein
MNTSCQQSVAAIRVSVVNQAFCPAQTAVYFDRKVARYPLLLLHSTVNFKFRDKKITDLFLREILKITK